MWLGGLLYLFLWVTRVPGQEGYSIVRLGLWGLALIIAVGMLHSKIKFSCKVVNKLILHRKIQEKYLFFFLLIIVGRHAFLPLM